MNGEELYSTLPVGTHPHELERGSRIGPAQDLHILPLESSRRQRKLFDLLPDALAERVEIPDVPLAARLDRNRHDAVVTNPVRSILTHVVLLDLQDSNRTALDHDTWSGCHIPQDHRIERIAVG